MRKLKFVVGVLVATVVVSSFEAGEAAAASAGCNFINAGSLTKANASLSRASSLVFDAGDVLTVVVSTTAANSLGVDVRHSPGAIVFREQGIPVPPLATRTITIPGAGAYDVESGSNASLNFDSIVWTCVAANAPSGGSGAVNPSALLDSLRRGQSPVAASISSDALQSVVTDSLDAAFNGSDNVSANNGSFRASTLAYATVEQKRADATTEALGLGGAKTGFAKRSPLPEWNAWVSGRYTLASGGAEHLGARHANFAGGVDRRLGDSLVLGLFVGVETFNYNSGVLAPMTFAGSGPSVGAYAGYRFDETYRLSGFVAFTRVGYQTSVLNASGGFHGDRFTGMAEFVARYPLGALVLEPRASVRVATESQNGFTDSLGALQPAFAFAVGRASLGSRVSYVDMSASDGWKMTPWIGMYGDLRFGNAAHPWLVTPIGVGSGLSARGALGLDMKTGDVITFGLMAEQGGLGSRYRTTTGRAALKINW